MILFPLIMLTACHESIRALFCRIICVHFAAFANFASLR